MPLGPLAQAGLSLAGNVVQSGANAALQGSMNRKTRKFAKEMYGMQRADALADWKMQNEYNSPAAQMARFKEAGLNPALIYGQSNEGGTVRSSDVKSWDPKAAEINLGATEVIQQYQDARLKTQSIDNMIAQKALLEEQRLKTAAETLGVLQSTDKSKFDLSQAMRTADLNFQKLAQDLEKGKADIGKVKADTEYTKNQDIRAAAQNSSSLREAAERMANLMKQRDLTDKQMSALDQTMKNQETERLMKEFELEMRKAGYNPNDPAWQRYLQRILKSMWDNIMNGEPGINFERSGIK